MVKRANEEDVRIGQSIRLLRLRRGMTQVELAEALGVSYQQVQKYEVGTNRIGGSRLGDIARTLSVEPNYFYDRAAKVEGLESLLTDKRNVRALVALSRISQEDLKDSLVRLVEQIASQAGADGLPSGTA